MNNEMQFTKNSLEAAHEIRRAVHQMDDIIYGLKSLGIPAGDHLLLIRNHISDLASECSDHIMKEAHEALMETQNQTWNLVGAVLEDAASKIKVDD